MPGRPASGPRVWATPAALLLLAACAGPGLPEPGETYLGSIAVELPGNERVLLRWPDEAMPLRVHVPPPPEGLFADPELAVEAVRSGVLAWADVAGPGVPSFTFVDRPGGADIPFAWEREFVGREAAFSAILLRPFVRRFRVGAIAISALDEAGKPRAPAALEAQVMHETGHALGLFGHSPDPRDLMYLRETPVPVPALSPRDRATLAALYARPNGSRVPRLRRSRDRRARPTESIDEAFRDYLARPGQKAFAVGYQNHPESRLAYGAAWGLESEEAAREQALARCDRAREQSGVRAPCRTYAVGDEVVFGKIPR